MNNKEIFTLWTTPQKGGNLASIHDHETMRFLSKMQRAKDWKRAKTGRFDRSGIWIGGMKPDLQILLNS